MPETPNTNSSTRPVAVVVHQCRRCGQSFPYRFDGRYDPTHLVDIDYICRACFDAYIREREVADCA